MPMPVLRNFNVLGEILVHKYERYLPTAFDESLTLLEKVNKVINYLNETGELVNDLVEDWNKVMEWVLQEGLTDSVNEKLETMATDGTLEQIINVDMIGVLGELETNYKGDLVGSINEVSADLAEIVTLITPSMTGQEIQNLLNNKGTFKFTKGNYHLNFLIGYNNAICLDVQSDTELIFEKGATITIPPNGLDNYNIVRIQDKDNVIINGARITGDILDHTTTGGEWGHGIAILGSTNITLNDIQSNNCWGDGLYVGISDIKDYCQNVTVNNFIADNNHRQGISIISIKTLRMNNLRLTNTQGTAPGAGLDFEPNRNTGFLEDIKVNNIYTENNMIGITFYVDRLIENSDKMIDIEINGHTDVGSQPPASIVRREETGSLHGKIVFNQPTWIKAKTRSCAINWFGDDYAKIIINEPTIIDPNVNESTTIASGSTFTIASDSLNKPVGNVTIIKPDIYSPSGFVSPECFRINGGDLTLIKNIRIIDPIRLLDKDSIRIGLEGVYVSDENSLTTKNLTELNTSTGFDYHSLYTNKGTATDTKVNLSADITNSYPSLTFECTSDSYDMLIDPDANSKILPFGTVGQRLRFSQGTRVTIKRVDSTTWQVTNVVGDVLAE